FVATDLHLGARPFAEQHAVADLEVDGNELALLVTAARAHSQDFTLRGLLLGGVGNDDAAGGLLLGIDALDDDAVVKRSKLHGYPPRIVDRLTDRYSELQRLSGSRMNPLRRLAAT